MTEMVNELADFLKPETRLDVKTLALHHVLSMTGSFESRQILIAHKTILFDVLTLAFKKDEQAAINKDALLTMINMCADELNAKQIMQKIPNLINLLIDYVCNETSKHADVAVAILSNLSRGTQNCKKIAEYFMESDSNNNQTETAMHTFEELLKCFCTENFNKSNNLNYLGPFLCNLTQLEEIRELILKNDLILLRLLPFISYSKSIIRRGGIIGAVKNICFDYENHERLLLSPEIDILSRLLLPLAGPEEFDADDMDKLPDDLQYLPPDKEREEDPDIRIMLIETLILLLCRKKNRDYIRSKNAYVILRELHKWETDEKALAVCEKAVHFLISDEPEKEHENYDQVMIPENLSKKFYEFDLNEMGYTKEVTIDKSSV